MEWRLESKFHTGRPYLASKLLLYQRMASLLDGHVECYLASDLVVEPHLERDLAANLVVDPHLERYLEPYLVLDMDRYVVGYNLE